MSGEREIGYNRITKSKDTQTEFVFTESLLSLMVALLRLVFLKASEYRRHGTSSTAAIENLCAVVSFPARAILNPWHSSTNGAIINGSRTIGPELIALTE